MKLLADLRETLTKAGLRFSEPPPGYDFTAIRGKKCFGRLLSEPNVHGVESLFKRVEEMHPVVKRPAFFRGREGQYVALENSVALVDEATDEPISVVSAGYNLVQDADLVREAAEAVRDLGLTPVGSVRQDGNRLQAALIMADKDYVIPLLKGHERSIASGFSFTNSYTGDLGIHAEAMGIDCFCINYNPWGRMLGELHLTHLTQGNLTEEVSGLLSIALKEAPKVQALYQVASELRVEQPQVPGLLAGAGFNEQQVLYVDEMKERLEPAWKKAPTLLNLNMACTVYATHVADTTPDTLRGLSRKAMALLGDEATVKRLQEKGRKVLHEWALRRAENERKKADAAVKPQASQ